ncbi:hypothetical protein [Rhodoblastus sp.]|uniref:hypothetical protein n=1 Tax=Rhodoblastus sp. TaxID=1962975 RepID=UPI003F98FD27
MSNLGFSLDRNFTASNATRRAGSLPPVISLSDREESSNPVLLGAIAFAAALFGALAGLFLF